MGVSRPLASEGTESCSETHAGGQGGEPAASRPCTALSLGVCPGSLSVKAQREAGPGGEWWWVAEGGSRSLGPHPAGPESPPADRGDPRLATFTDSHLPGLVTGIHLL